MKKVIGLTGGIASGKSTVVDFLVAQSFKVIDADKVVRGLQAPGGRLYQIILSEFGSAFFTVEGQLDREKLAALVFSNPAQREKLSKLQDQIIREELYAERERLLTASSADEIIFMDIPLLLEYHYTGFDEIWLVAAPENLQIERLMARNHLSKEEAVKRIATQMPLAEKRKLASRIFENIGSVEELQSQVQAAINELKKK